MANIRSLSQLQVPEVASVNGEIRPYGDVTVHISAEALTRALSIFEGVKAYWDTDVQLLGVRTLEAHYLRLCRSAALLHIPIEFSLDEYRAWLLDLACRLAVPEQDIWLRTTLHGTVGHWGEGTHADLIITAFRQTKERAPEMRMGVSTWRRASDSAMPARIKSSANYQVSRLARIEGTRHGYDDMILLNDRDRVAEATGACILIARAGTVVTPPPSEGALESLTVDIIEAICRESGIAFERRPVERSEVLVADEAALAGTISEVMLVSEVDGFEKQTDGILATIRDEYLAVMRREVELAGVTFTTVPREQVGRPSDRTSG